MVLRSSPFSKSRSISSNATPHNEKNGVINTMKQPWEQLDIDKILNSEADNPALIAQYERIMQHRTIQAMNGLSNRLDKAIGQIEASSTSQDRQQSAMKLLTGALVFCTLAYTGITGWSTWEMHQGNGIQSKVAQSAEQQAKAAQAANSIQCAQLSNKAKKIKECALK